MKYVRPRPWWLIVLIYAAGGVLVGASVPWLKTLATSHFGRAGFAVAFVLNIAMPLWVAVLSLIYPSFRTALGGTLAASVGFGMLVGQIPLPRTTDWLYVVFSHMNGRVLVAMICYHLIAFASVGAMYSVRRVGRPPAPQTCKSCGYSLVGLVEPRCPECFTPYETKTVRPR